MRFTLIAMLDFLAYAQNSDQSELNLRLVVVCVAEVAGVCTAALALIGAARSRRHGRAETIMVLAIFWGLLAGASLIHNTIAQSQWEKEYRLRIMTGYYDPRDVRDAPAAPLKTWAGLGAAYAGLLVWSLAARKTAATSPPAVG